MSNRLKNPLFIIAALVLLVVVALFIRFGIPFLTAEDEASRDVEVQRIQDVPTATFEVTPSTETSPDSTPEAEATTDTAGTTSTETPDGFRSSFLIASDESEVRFILNEELNRQPTTVIGRTNQVAGEIIVDTLVPANSLIGPIEINLRTLETDSSSRNRMIRSEILKSGRDEYEFTTFVPTAIEGLPDTVTVGTPFTFTVTGDLKLVDTTRSVTFTITLTPVSEERIEGVGTANVLRSDYGLQIPSVPQVANVTDEVALEIEFVALRVDE